MNHPVKEVRLEVRVGGALVSSTIAEVNGEIKIKKSNLLPEKTTYESVHELLMDVRKGMTNQYGENATLRIRNNYGTQ